VWASATVPDKMLAEEYLHVRREGSHGRPSCTKFSATTAMSRRRVVLQKPLLLANRTNRQSLGYRLFSFQSEDFPNELNLPKDIPFRQPPHLAFPDHVQNLVALNRPPGSIGKSKTLPLPWWFLS
jgi:hypothetical protein